MIGASRNPGRIGHQIVQNLVTHGFTGTVYPVNPSATSVCTIRAYPSVGEIPDPVDLAVIAVPKDDVISVANQCGDAGVRGLSVISAGFREVGEDGASRERQLLEIVRRYGMRMIGPNCMGALNTHPDVSMNATFATVMPPFGHAGFVSQSGALGLSVLDYAREYGIGISQFVSVGNKADVSSNDLLELWENDDTVQVILMYVESFGNPQRFLEIAGRVTKTKPIIVVKSGKSRSGARAASSHTGALAANDTAVEALLAQAGVHRAASVEELFDMAMAFEVRSLPRSRRTAVLTNAGGPGILAADAMDACSLQLPELSASTIEKLRPLFPAEASIRNPLDMIASATPSGYEAAMSALLDDPSIDAVVPIFVPPFGVKQEDVAAALVGGSKNSTKPVLAVLMGREGLPAGRAELHGAGIPAYVFPESAARALATLNRQVDWSTRSAASSPPLGGIDRSHASSIIEAARRQGREQLSQVEALDVLRAYGIGTATIEFARSEDDAVQLAAKIGYPVALKIVSADVVHKTDIGAVRIGIASDEQLRNASREIIARVRERAPGARIDGLLVQQMVDAGVETIVGMTRDPSFGPLVMFGLGGIFVEALHDAVFRLAPLNESDALGMTHAIRGAALLDGVRGRPAADRAALVAILRRIAQLAVDHPEILELDLNPVCARPTGAIAVDARIRVSLK